MQPATLPPSAASVSPAASLIGEDALRAMKPTAILVNTAPLPFPA